MLMTAKEQLTTREGKPYFRVGFRDRGREVSFPIWDNSPLAAECRENWTPGRVLQGPGRLPRDQLRPATGHPQDPRGRRRRRRRRLRPDDVPAAVAVRSAADVRRTAGHRPPSGSPTPPLRALVESILLRATAQALLRMPAARHNHHAFVGRLLEHTLSVTRTGRLPGRQVCRLLSRHAAAAGPRHGRGRGHPARHRQAPRAGAAAGRDRLHGRGRADRPHAAGPRHRPRGGRRVRRCPATCCCGWST